jgi:hypothetical protein
MRDLNYNNGVHLDKIPVSFFQQNSILYFINNRRLKL